MRFLLLAAALAPAQLASQSAAPASPPAAPLSSRLEAVVAAHHARGAFDGVVLVGRGDQIVYQRAIGMADRSWNVANTTETRFPWASITKQATSALVLQLVGEGKLSLDAPLSTYLPGLRAGHAGRVTLRHLLTNSSGLPNTEALPGYYIEADSARQAMITQALAADLASEPGTKFVYNNLDFLLAGRVVEAVTGQPFEAAMRSRILDRAGLRATSMIRDDRVEPRLAQGYVGVTGADSARGFAPQPPTRIASYGAAGALAGTAEDLFRFDRALLGGRLFPAAMRDTMFRAEPALGFVALSVWRYPLVFGDRRVTLVERQGAIGGYANLNLIAPEQDLVVIVLSNVDTADLFMTYGNRGLAYELMREAQAEVSVPATAAR
ncbi:MAG TPA: serine hydrolase domain-containing protein [Longimicrobium sp.]|uniref:serine hydrolase domain-containing protein n=1 Tax=Longimicrobium sp. TaxID=2029185 RepID=UPI002ED776E8